MRRLLWLALAGCTVGPQYQRPEIAVPKAFSEGGAAGPASFERWWAGFHDPLLESLVARAVEGNLDLQLGAARIREARAARGIAAAAGLPQVSASGGYTLSKLEASNPISRLAGTSARSTPRPAMASAPVTTPLTSARRRNQRSRSGSSSRTASALR